MVCFNNIILYFVLLIFTLASLFVYLQSDPIIFFHEYKYLPMLFNFNKSFDINEQKKNGVVVQKLWAYIHLGVHFSMCTYIQNTFIIFIINEDVENGQIVLRIIFFLLLETAVYKELVSLVTRKKTR